MPLLRKAAVSGKARAESRLMSIRADREFQALETRSETLDVFSCGSFAREGESGQIEAGTGGLIDGIEGGEEATCGSLAETYGRKLNRQVGGRELAVYGSCRGDGKDEMTPP